MAHFVVSYDLHGRRDYLPVWDLLESWDAVRLLDSLWVVTLQNSAGDLLDALNEVVDDDDSIAVLELQSGSEWATRLAKPDGVAWLQANILA